MERSHFEKLTVVVPISRMSGKLQNLASWLPIAFEHNVNIILVHDKRDEDTSRELAELVTLNSGCEIVLIEGYFGSPGAARNIGKVQVTTDWVAFWDSDDIPIISNFMEMLSLNKNMDIAIGNYVERDFNSGLRKHNKTDPLNFQEQILFRLGIWRMAFKRTVISDKFFPELSMGEDQVFFADLDKDEMQIGWSSNTVYEYFTNQTTSLTANKKAKSDLFGALNSVILIMARKDKQGFNFTAQIFWGLLFSWLIYKPGNILKLTRVFSICLKELTALQNVRLQIQVLPTLLLKVGKKIE